MDSGNLVERVKPYGIGIVGGAVIGVIVVFASGWAVTSAAMSDAVHEAKVEPMASLCVDQALASWKSRGKEADALIGWDNREKRASLVESVTGTWDVPADLKDDVVDACEEGIT